jgi:hypothetical protein
MAARSLTAEQLARKQQRKSMYANHTNTPTRRWLPFEDVKWWIRAMGITSWLDWLKFCKLKVTHGRRKGQPVKPFFIPSNLSKVYRDEWVSYVDVFGSNPKRPSKNAKLPFEEHVRFIKAMGFTHPSQYDDYMKKHPKFVRKGYRTKAIAIFNGKTGSWSKHICELRYLKLLHAKDNWLTYAEARAIVHAKKLSNAQEYDEWIKSSDAFPGIPVRPDCHYDEWVSWIDWLGKDAIAKLTARIGDENPSVLYIATVSPDPDNVYIIDVHELGKKHLFESLKSQREKRILVTVPIPQKVRLEVFAFLENYTETWWKDPRKVVIYNLFDLAFKLCNEYNGEMH